MIESSKNNKEKPVYIDSCESTNTMLKENAFSLPDLYTLFTGNQSGGRGRQGKVWECRNGEGVAVSVLLRDVKGDELLKLPVIAAVAAAAVCEKLTGESCLIKWPNDIICKEKKLCGILCESRCNDGEYAAILGFGVNLLLSEEDFILKNLPYAGSVKSLSGKIISPHEVAKHLLKEIKICLEKPFNEILGTYKELCLTIGREITVINGNDRYTAFAKGLTEKGELVVMRDGEEITVNSGIASIRGLDGFYF